MHYVWAAKYGPLAIVVGNNWYLAETTLNYVEPIQPPNVHLNVIEDATSAQICTWDMDNDLDRRD